MQRVWVRVAQRQCDISIESFHDVTAAILEFQKGDLAALGRPHGFATGWENNKQTKITMEPRAATHRGLTKLKVLKRYKATVPKQ